jgi:hypothetical protein
MSKNLSNTHLLILLFFVLINILEANTDLPINNKRITVPSCYFKNTNLAKDLSLIDNQNPVQDKQPNKSFIFKATNSNKDLDLTDSSSENKPTANNEYLSELDLIKKDVSEQKYTAAIFAINILGERLREQQKKEIESYVPNEFQDFKVWDQNIKLGDFISQNDNFGVLFSRRYKNSNDHIIDINIVFSDPSIKEYLNIIKKPDLVDNILENTKVIKVNNKYDALEKYSAEEKYYERNIVVNRELLLNIVANGIENTEVIDTFTSLIKIEELSNKLTL